MIVDDSSPAVAQLSKATRAASSELFPCKNVNTKWPPVRQTCKSVIFFGDEREQQYVF